MSREHRLVAVPYAEVIIPEYVEIYAEVFRKAAPTNRLAESERLLEALVSFKEEMSEGGIKIPSHNIAELMGDVYYQLDPVLVFNKNIYHKTIYIAKSDEHQIITILSIEYLDGALHNVEIYDIEGGLQ